MGDNHILIHKNTVDKIEIRQNLTQFTHQSVKNLTFKIYINDEHVNFYVDFFSFMFSKNNICEWWKLSTVRQRGIKLHSCFTPFTCSCGISGCVGINSGISGKHRKHTVEWRVPPDNGYGRILKKRFYRFDLRQYEKAIGQVVRWLWEHKDYVVTYGDSSIETTIQDVISDHNSSFIDYIDSELQTRWKSMSDFADY